MTNKLKKEKTKGWANLQQQLKEVREESFKQGIWKERDRVWKLVDELNPKQIAINSREEQLICLIKEKLKGGILK